MGILGKLKKYVSNKDYRFLVNADRGCYNHWDDEKYLKRMFRAIIGRELDLENPQTMNEKLQWLKIHNRKPEYTMMADKYLVRDYIRKKLGEEYLIPLLGAWDSPDEINFDTLPDRFVLKCNHNSGLGMYICKDKSKMDVQKVKRELRRGLAQNYYWTKREWQYKDIPRKIICEQYMTDSPDVDDFTDYKFYCFNGVVDCVLLCYDRASGDTKFYFFDRNWELKRYNRRGIEAPADFTLPKPPCMDEMFRIAEELSQGFPFLRVDLYVSNGKIYFGELTFFPDSGFEPNRLPEIDRHFGDMIDLQLCRKNGEEK